MKKTIISLIMAVTLIVSCSAPNNGTVTVKSGNNKDISVEYYTDDTVVAELEMEQIKNIIKDANKRCKLNCNFSYSYEPIKFEIIGDNDSMYYVNVDFFASNAFGAKSENRMSYACKKEMINEGVIDLWTYVDGVYKSDTALELEKIIKGLLEPEPTEENKIVALKYLY
jgi:hypothetical protein